ncbi:class I SAM-dependent methyltransferase [Accumulibacter sp.]|uniref:class I SAM-dependent methyltransferase n=1 Tax=Accumulibacter sp. TaxID=2053492 RepID=UPI001A4CEDE1|nr:class I SAM-dependent methyltransferase [Accumulibacter sp.]MBL8375697.1 class I SAM-dependent methyltransferase [Accumulibacter sp.]
MYLKYETLEKLPVQRPVDRLDFIADQCVGKVVLDIGCFDETALVKRETRHWLHGRLAAKAKVVVGVDNSTKIPREGLQTAANAAIYCGDGVHVDESLAGRNDYDVIVAGEFIEHIENPLEFFREMKTRFPGRELLISTPNGVSFANTLLGLIGREVQHHDHLHNFTFKILNTLCLRAGFTRWEIIPYRFYATEMILNSTGAKRAFVSLVESSIKLVERMFPLLSFGYILRVSI